MNTNTVAAVLSRQKASILPTTVSITSCRSIGCKTFTLNILTEIQAKFCAFAWPPTGNNCSNQITFALAVLTFTSVISVIRTSVRHHHIFAVLATYNVTMSSTTVKATIWDLIGCRTVRMNILTRSWGWNVASGSLPYDIVCCDQVNFSRFHRLYVHRTSLCKQ